MDYKKLLRRVLVAAVGAPLIIFLILKGRLPFVILVLIINVVAQFEFYKLHETKAAYPLKWIGAIGATAITFSFYYLSLELVLMVFFLLLYLFLLVELFRNKASAVLNTATSSLGLLYPPFFFSFLIRIRELPNELDMNYNVGGRWLVLIIITIWICDTAAYFIGKAIGRHKLFKRISPHKTVEGAVAGVVFSFITVYIFHLTYIKTLSLLNCLMVGLIVAVFSQTGDLVESMFKRDAATKDSSNLLPGHGGMLDRFDAPLFIAPMMFFYFKYIVFV